MTSMNSQAGTTPHGAGQPAAPVTLPLRVPGAQEPPFSVPRWKPGASGWAERRRDDGRWILYLMGQGLADLGNIEIRRPYVATGQEFEVKIGFRHPRHEDAGSRAAIEALAMASLWLACAYGGIGARTRRGLGGVRITGASGTELPEPWAKDGSLLTPGLDYYTPLRMIWPDGPVASCMRYFTVLARGARLNPRAWEGIPTFPVVARR